MRSRKDKSQSSLALNAVIQRKDPKLPRFVVVPSVLLDGWGIEGTTVVEGQLNSVDMGRRTLKRWDDQRWFVELPEPVCKRAGVDTGNLATLILRIAPDELPGELVRLIATDRRAKSAWEKLTAGQQRMLREHVAAAKQPATRERRARQALC